MLAEAAGELGSRERREVGREPFGAGYRGSEPEVERLLVGDLLPVGKGVPGTGVGEDVPGEVGLAGIQQPRRSHDELEPAGEGEKVAETVGDHGSPRLEPLEGLQDRGPDLARGRGGLVGSGGSPGQWAEELTGAVLEHGASGFMLFSPPGGTPDIDSLARWAGEIVPAVREAIAKEKA